MDEVNIPLHKSESKKGFSKNVILPILLIGGIGFFLRILFLHEEIPLNYDNFLYFRYTIDLLVGDGLPADVVSNNGWALFLYPFFAILNSNDFMDYMILQKYLSIIISVLTIVPIYFLCRNFFNKLYSIVGSAIFVFEPRLIQNSLFGVTEPLYLISLVTAISLFFSKKNYLQYTAFAILSCTAVIRAEALFIIPVFYLMFFVREGINKKSILNIMIISLIIVSILVPVSMHRSEQMGNDGLTDRVYSGAIHVSSINQNSVNDIISFYVDGVINLVKFLGWSQIPYLILFAPVGVILFLKNFHFKQKTLLVIGVISMIPALYAYSFASDSRYLFVLYPLFCVFSTYTIYYIMTKFHLPKKFLLVIFSIILISSVLYLDWKDIDQKHELDAYNLAFEVAKRTKLVNAYPPESTYLDVIGLTEVNHFPIKTEEYVKKRYVNYHYDKINSLQEFLEDSKKLGVTHLVIDNNEERQLYLKEIFYHENEYPYLVKEFDSKALGYEYHLKVFKIDYEEVDRLN